MSRRLLFVSPHLDDVVLSCAGTILQARADGDQVIVATVMSHGDESDLHPRRREEDRAALARLGVEPLWLGSPDAPWRSPFYRSFTAIVLEEHESDRTFAPLVAARLRSLAHEIRPDEIFLPLAVGTHIDHRIVHESWRALSDVAAIAFYEDRPYALLTPSVAMRLGELGVAADGANRPTPDQVHELLTGLRAAPHIRAYLSDGGERFRAARALVRRLLRPRPEAELELAPETRAFGDDIAKAVREAILCYSSQLADLFGDPTGLGESYARYARTLKGDVAHAERMWHLA